MPAIGTRWYTMVAMYTNAESYNAQRHRQTVVGQTDDDRIDDANSRSYCVAVRSAKNSGCATDRV